MPNFNKETKQQIVTTGLILILAVAFFGALLILNLYITDRLGQLQVAIQNNNSRLAQIETFLNQQIQAAQSQPKAAPVVDQNSKK